MAEALIHLRLFVRWGTRPYQETYTTTLENAAKDVVEKGIEPPAVFVVGNVVKLREEMRWFDNRPLFGKRIIITRSRTQASRLANALKKEAHAALKFPPFRLKRLLMIMQAWMMALNI